MIRRPYHQSMLVFGAFVVAGLLSLALGAAGITRAEDSATEVAFATSGGLGGLALVGTGGALAVVQRRRWVAARARAELARLQRSASALVLLLEEHRR